MTRIIAGWAGSRRLLVPRNGTRPTTDRVREAMFSMLEARGVLRRATVIDLYAGSGALGFEALSRGATTLVLVEKARAAADMIGRNAQTLRQAAPMPDALDIRVVATGVREALAGGTLPQADVVFLDPPYDTPEEILASDLAALVPFLAPDAVVLVERSARSPEPRWPDALTLDRRRNYGETTVWWADAERPEPEDAESEIGSAE